MFFKCRIYIFVIILSEDIINLCNSYITPNNRRQNNVAEDSSSDEISSSKKYIKYNKIMNQKKECWMRFNSKNHFEIMDKLDERYADILKEYQDAAEKDNLDEQMLDVMVKTRGAAEREVQHVDGDSGLIPAGINLGGYFMMRMPNSLLFFHRMKLRNNTHFRVTYLHNDLVNLTLHARLSLNELHLQGSFDRSNTDKDPSILFYTPTYGQVEILLKNVQYLFEGRYRLLKDRLTIELIISGIDFDDVIMTYLNNAKNVGIRLQRNNIDDFLIRLKSDLDKWAKDYFNDYLMYFGLVGAKSIDKFQQYDKERAKELNVYIDNVIALVTRRLHEINAESVVLPRFTIFTVNSMEILLKDGVLRGLDSMYRRSIATGKKEGNIRKADAVIGFSNLKVTYQYEALLASGSPVLSGMIILSADELTAHMGVAVVQDSDTADIQFEFLEQAKPESLTIEGAANRMISNFKYLLEQHIISIMTNTLHYNIKMLSSLTRCVPLLHGHKDSDNITSEEERNSTDQENEDNMFTTENTTNKNVDNRQSDNKKPIEIGLSTSPENILETFSNFKANLVSVNSDRKINSNDTSNEKTEDPTFAEEDTQTEESDTFQHLNSADNKIIVIEDNRAKIELPSNEVQHKHKIHLKYTKNLTLTKIDSE